MYKCPDCESTELDVTITTMARLVQDKDGPQTLADEAECGDHEWDDNSIMVCRECGYQAIAEEFECEDEDEDEDDEEEDDDNVGDDLCDQCGEAGIAVDHTDNDGDTVCVRCAREGAEEDEDDATA